MVVYLAHVSEEIHDVALEFVLLSPYLCYVNIYEAVVTELVKLLSYLHHINVYMDTSNAHLFQFRQAQFCRPRSKIQMISS